MDPSLGVRGASKYLLPPGITKSIKFAIATVAARPLLLLLLVISYSRGRWGKGSSTWNEICLSYVLLWNPRSGYPFAFFFLLDPGRVCRTILYDVLLFLHMETRGKVEDGKVMEEGKAVCFR